MEQRSISRIKCAMIVYELERALGRFAREKDAALHTTNVAQEILKRNADALPIESKEVTRHVIENSYLGEIFSLAHASAKGTSDSEKIATLEKLSLALDLFDIRNAISHPNRFFPDCYWYRCAAIASDPTIDGLELFEVSLAFQNAEAGRLQEPPEDWLYKKRWSVPAVIPADFEHAVTGLVGRFKESALLQKELKNKRAPLIALVAKGGVGKTSLMLQVVSDFCLSTEVTQHFDGVLWTSLKQERLTPSGIQILSAPASLEEMECLLCKEAAEIFGQDFNSFTEMKAELGSKRVLLCLDNLETLLRDSPQSFYEFYEDLPENWKVTVTSRIPVDGAKNITLGVLDKQGATALARSYLHSKGQPTQDNDLLEKISVGCNFNPLAIRLTIELYISGAEITEALQKAEKDVLDFSFTSLLDQLTPLENNVLETIFSLESPNRTELCGALDCSIDEIAQAISKLSKTSLITRQDSDAIETYSLGSSIRDLLRSNPRNLSIRSKAAEWLAKSRETAESALKLQLERKISPVDLHYIPPQTPASHIAISKQIKAAVKREDRAGLVKIESQLRHMLAAEVESSFLCRLHAKTTLELDDVTTAISQFQRSSALDPSDPAPLFGLALAFQSKSNKIEIYNATKRLIDLGWGDAEKSGAQHANRIWSLHLHSANVSDKHDEVLELTADWNEKIDVLPSLAVGRATVHRRAADAEFHRDNCDNLQIGKLLSESSRLMLKVIIGEGFAKWLISELRKLINELRFYKSQGIDFQSFEIDHQTNIKNLLRYCLSNEANRRGIDSTEVFSLLSTFGGNETRFIDQQKNPRQNNIT